jgi:hypothetical protein
MVDIVGKFTEKNATAAHKELVTSDLVGRPVGTAASRFGGSPKASAAEAKRDAAVMTREPKPAARKHRWS